MVPATLRNFGPQDLSVSVETKQNFLSRHIIWSNTNRSVDNIESKQSRFTQNWCFLEMKRVTSFFSVTRLWKSVLNSGFPSLWGENVKLSCAQTNGWDAAFIQQCKRKMWVSFFYYEIVLQCTLQVLSWLCVCWCVSVWRVKTQRFAARCAARSRWPSRPTGDFTPG